MGIFHHITTCIKIGILLLFLYSCKNNIATDELIPVSDGSVVNPIEHWKTHHEKLKNGRIATFTIPAEYSDKYDKAAGIYCFQDLSLEDRIAFGIKDDNESYFAICSSYEGLGEYKEKQLDSINIRDRLMRALHQNELPIFEKYKDNQGQIYYHSYFFEIGPPAVFSWFDRGYVNKSIVVALCSVTVYGDTMYWSNMRFISSAMDFDFPIYRKIMHSFRIR